MTASYHFEQDGLAGGFGIEVNALSFERCELLDELAWCFEEASR